MQPETPSVGVRQSIYALQQAYAQGDRKPLEDLIRAWKGIQELPSDDPRSFYVLGGYHGEPFQLRPAVDALGVQDIYAYWGGYCNHGNVLFPTWHRIYVRKLEEALQSIVPGVMMPFWDETDAHSLAGGIPEILTQETFELDGEIIKNPLRSFVLPEKLNDDYWQDSENGEHSPYYKPAGYETVRYPLSGLVGNPADQAATAAHNAQFPDPAESTALLNQNVRVWLHGGAPTPTQPDPHSVGVYQLFRRCLEAPNYTVFSNTTSATAWSHAGGGSVVPLEQPHNDVHLAVGGFDLPGAGGASGQIDGANGDMGENNTAGLDPIFFFHHCNVDRMFWLWQKKNGFSEKFDIIAGYAGTSSSDSQGPTPGVAPGTPLSMTTPLSPFINPTTNQPYTSQECIRTQDLGYTYGPGSLEGELPPLPADGSTRFLVISGVDRALFQGYFVIQAWVQLADEDGTPTERYLGHHAVLSRWSVIGCANCRTHLEVIARLPLSSLSEAEVDRATFRVEVRHRGKALHKNFQMHVAVSD